MPTKIISLFALLCGAVFAADSERTLILRQLVDIEKRMLVRLEDQKAINVRMYGYSVQNALSDYTTPDLKREFTELAAAFVRIMGTNQAKINELKDQLHIDQQELAKSETLDSHAN